MEIISLNWQWMFHWAKDPDSRIKDFYTNEYDVSSWDKVNIPGNWQLQGYGKPIYTNIPYPFQRDEPRVTSIDLNLNGVAGVNTWGGRALPEYTIDGNLPYHYSFIIKAK